MFLCLACELCVLVPDCRCCLATKCALRNLTHGKVCFIQLEHWQDTHFKQSEWLEVTWYALTRVNFSKIHLLKFSVHKISAVNVQLKYIEQLLLIQKYVQYTFLFHFRSLHRNWLTLSLVSLKLCERSTVCPLFYLDIPRSHWHW